MHHFKNMAARIPSLRNGDRTRICTVTAAVARAAVETLEGRRLFAIATTPAGGEFHVNTYTTDDQQEPSAAADADGNFVIAWDSFGQDGSNAGIYAQRYNAAGVPQGGEFRVNTTTAGGQYGAAVAMDDDGDFVIAWRAPDANDSGIYAQRYNAAGVPQGGELLVNSITAGAQLYPEVAMDADGDFVVTWQGPDTGGSTEVFARRFNAGGVPQGSEFPVNSTLTGTQNHPSVAMDDDGDFVVTWQSQGTATTVAVDVFARRVNAAGTPQGDEFCVNTYTTRNQGNPAIALDADGDFVVTWQSYLQDGSDYGVYAQRFNAAGTPQGDEFRANTSTTGVQAASAVAMNAAGDFLVSWAGRGSGGFLDVFAQRYTAAGDKQGAPFVLNSDAPAVGTSSPPSQGANAIAMDDSGDFVVAWQSGSQEALNDDGIYAQRYKESASAPPTLSSTAIGAGTQQRSQLKQLTLTFSQPVNLAPAALKLELLNTGGSGTNNNAPATDASAALATPITPDNGKTWVFTFAATSSFVQNGSLTDGIYRASINPAKVTVNGVAMTAAPQPFTFHRLFGDITGDGTVNASDYFQFRNTFNKATGQAGFVPEFDITNDGVINSGDYFQFRNRYGKALAI